MTLLDERASLRRPLSAPLRRSLAWHPEWWVYAVGGAAALLLVAGTLASPDAGAAAGHHVHEGHHARGPSPDVQGPWASWLSAWEHWALMVAAMMLPVIAPQVRRVSTRSLWSRHHRAAVGFVLGYLVVWLVLGAGLVAVVLALGGQEQLAPWLAVVLLLAAGWQVSGPRRRVLRRCASLRLGAATGPAADLDCARAGLRSGVRCMFTCGPLMVTMVLSHSLLLMAGVLVVLLSERARGANPLRRAGRPHEALVLGGFAVVAAVAVPFW
jgi:predicted metal-binding membrane protein